MFSMRSRASNKFTPTKERHSTLEIADTFSINNPEQLKDVVGKETIVICGSARGMTSVVSFTLFELGYFIGSELQSQNFEDQEFSRAIPPRARFKGELRSRPAFQTLVESRNLSHERWGFKLPGATDYVQELSSTLRNPVFVLCIRNPLAVMRTISRRNPHFQGSTPEFYHKGLGWLDAMGFLMSSDSIPSIMIDMDEVRRIPETFLMEFSRVLNFDDIPDGLLEKISRPGYKGSRRQSGVTFVGPRDKRG